MTLTPDVLPVLLSGAGLLSVILLMYASILQRNTKMSAQVYILSSAVAAMLVQCNAVIAKATEATAQCTAISAKAAEMQAIAEKAAASAPAVDPAEAEALDKAIKDIQTVTAALAAAAV